MGLGGVCFSILQQFGVSPFAALRTRSQQLLEANVSSFTSSCRCPRTHSDVLCSSASAGAANTGAEAERGGGQCREDKPRGAGSRIGTRAPHIRLCGRCVQALPVWLQAQVRSQLQQSNAQLKRVHAYLEEAEAAKKEVSPFSSTAFIIRTTRD